MPLSVTVTASMSSFQVFLTVFTVSPYGVRGLSGSSTLSIPAAGADYNTAAHFVGAIPTSQRISGRVKARYSSIASASFRVMKSSWTLAGVFRKPLALAAAASWASSRGGVCPLQP
ncbi:hypothetical protein F1880_001186 [Penicillium rolfsii]|nr:hypothetical protein F1880_001186 [Penicillium rolfsii]